MSQPQPPHLAKLVVGLFMRQRESISPVAGDLTLLFGAIDMVSPWFDFTYTHYYAPEMGTPLSRRVLVFKELIRQRDLADIKQQTNAVEHRYGRDGRRSVNIDPGYLERLSDAYSYYFFHYRETPLLVVNTDDIDFVNNPEDFNAFVEQILRSRRGTQVYVPVSQSKP